MSYREVSEIRDGMRIDWDMPIDDGRRAGAARRHLPADQEGTLSGPPQPRPLRQVAALRGRLQDRLGPHGAEASERDGRLDQQVPELGNLRPGEVGAGRLRLRARRFARLRPLARLRGALVAARDQGLLQLHRVGGPPALVERQGRLERHLLLRHQPVAGREPAAQASRRHLRLGRASPISIASSATTAASTTPSRRTGTTCRSRPCSTVSAPRAIAAA